MREFFLPITNEHGSTLVLTMLTLVLLTLIGIFATTTSNIETQIAGNEESYKTSFFASDGGGEAGCELIEQNIELAGFAASDGLGTNTRGHIEVGRMDKPKRMAVPAPLFYMKQGPPRMPSDQERDVYFPGNYAGNMPHTNLTINGNTTLSTGNALQMIAGYEGIGKGSAGGGGHMVFDVLSGHKGTNNSDVTIRVQWRHVL